MYYIFIPFFLVLIVNGAWCDVEQQDPHGQVHDLELCLQEPL